VWPTGDTFLSCELRQLQFQFICGANGKPMTKESFGNAFSVACRAAGVNKSAHGLRKIGATRAANNGATVAALNNIFGWSESKMASLYTANADRARPIARTYGQDVNKLRPPMGKVRRETSKGK
jgi:hypothetical protein